MTHGRIWLLCSALAAMSASPALAQPTAAREDGRRAFDARCAGCHGADAAGGERGPSLVDIREPRAPSSATLRQLIATGIPGTGMPAFQMPDAELNALVAYLEVLTMPAAERPADGDAKAGERFFSGAGQCSACHIVRGKGGILGPDLSSLARERRVPQIERGMQHLAPERRGISNREVSPPDRAVAVKLRDGRAFRGVVKYDSVFDLGLHTVDGTYSRCQRIASRRCRRSRRSCRKSRHRRGSFAICSRTSRV
jgi:mono/diheme cytochrome c family protein